ncbi:hypothetical protein A0H81_14300 [Grifola frondosa]|uniref:Uncharacterized protein n=1 Tax=Grifola frondosa TaxID=5627 RepID=A0A1C7LSE9_GRIFR|nr:hypothetical protein A0H81_14300 [Grifola frondosa]
MSAIQSAFLRVQLPDLSHRENDTSLKHFLPHPTGLQSSARLNCHGWLTKFEDTPPNGLPSESSDTLHQSTRCVDDITQETRPLADAELDTEYTFPPRK